MRESESEAAQSCPTLCNPMDYIACQAPPSMGFLGQEYWSGLPFPIPGNLSDSGMEPMSPVSPALRVDTLLLSHPGSPTGGYRLLNTQYAISNAIWS